jgi:hypothetical protein
LLRWNYANIGSLEEVFGNSLGPVSMLFKIIYSTNARGFPGFHMVEIRVSTIYN